MITDAATGLITVYRTAPRPGHTPAKIEEPEFGGDSIPPALDLDRPAA